MRTNTKEDSSKEEKTETIVLSDLEKIENVTQETSYLEDDDFEYNIIDNNKGENKEFIAELDKLKTRTFDLYYKIDNQKTKELESVFKQSKLKINLIQLPKVLKDGVLWTSSKKSFIMYDSKFFRKISEILFENECNIASAIELDNKDLVLLGFVKEGDSWEGTCKILIYRLKNDKYELIQIKNETQKGYSSQFVQYGFCSRSISKKPYHVEYIKKISGNRFICVNSYGFKIYASNEKQEYSIISLNEYLEGIKIIYEINPNKFIFGTEKRSSNHYIRYNNNILFQVVDLKEITKDEINKKLNELDESDREYFGFFYFSSSNQESKVSEESKNILESLKVSCSFKTIFHYNRGEYSYIRDYIILKNKYMILFLDSTLFVINLDTEEILKKFDIKIAAKDKYVNHVQICMKKWNNGEDNNFFLFIYGNFYLLELYEDGKEIGLKILNHSYFPNFENEGNVEKLAEKENKFFIQDYKTKSIILY